MIIRHAALEATMFRIFLTVFALGAVFGTNAFASNDINCVVDKTTALKIKTEIIQGSRPLREQVVRIDVISQPGSKTIGSFEKTDIEAYEFQDGRKFFLAAARVDGNDGEEFFSSITISGLPSAQGDNGVMVGGINLSFHDARTGSNLVVNNQAVKCRW